MASAALPKISLTYLSVRGLAEPLRMLARSSNFVFAADETLPAPHFRSLPPAQKAVFSRSEQLPSLHVITSPQRDSVVISQSGACMRLLAQVVDRYPTDLLRRARADAVFETAQELADVNRLANFHPAGADRDAMDKAFFGMAFRRRMRFCERLLDEASTDDAGCFFGGKIPNYADFQLFHMLDLSLFIKPNCLDKSPKMKAWMVKMSSLPAIAAYLEERPQQGTMSVGYEGSRMYGGGE